MKPVSGSLTKLGYVAQGRVVHEEQLQLCLAPRLFRLGCPALLLLCCLGLPVFSDRLGLPGLPSWRLCLVTSSRLACGIILHRQKSENCAPAHCRALVTRVHTGGR